MALVGTRERERAAEALRRHFAGGRLSVDELDERVHLALQARDGRDLRRALRGLPPVWRDADELRTTARDLKRRATRTVVAALWIVGTLVLLGGFVTAAVEHGATAPSALAYLAVWLLVSALAWRARRRA